MRDSLSVAAAAALIKVSKPTLRRMFDADLPESGTVDEAGRTGGRERRVDAEWAELMRLKRAAERADAAQAACEPVTAGGPAGPGL
jgi:hypothetical protein